jgi:hypothetical protein
VIRNLQTFNEYANFDIKIPTYFNINGPVPSFGEAEREACV